MQLIDDEGKVYEVENGLNIVAESGTCYGEPYTHIIYIDSTDDECCHAELHLREMTK